MLFKFIRHIKEGQWYDDKCFIGWKVYPNKWKVAFNFYLFTIAFRNWKCNLSNSGYIQFWSRFIKNSSVIEIK